MTYAINEFSVNPNFSVDADHHVIITAKVAGVPTLTVMYDFTGEHKVTLLPLVDGTSAWSQTKLASEALAWFDDEFFA